MPPLTERFNLETKVFVILLKPGRNFFFRKQGKPILIAKTNTYRENHTYRENQYLSRKPILFRAKTCLSGKPIPIEKTIPIGKTNTYRENQYFLPPNDVYRENQYPVYRENQYFPKK